MKNSKSTKTLLILLTIYLLFVVISLAVSPDSKPSTGAIIVLVIYSSIVVIGWVLYLKKRGSGSDSSNTVEKMSSSDSVHHHEGYGSSRNKPHDDNRAAEDRNRYGIGTSNTNDQYIDYLNRIYQSRSSVNDSTPTPFTDSEAENRPERSNTFVCVRCSKEMPLKYLHKRNMCADCFNLEKREQEKNPKTIRTDWPHNRYSEADYYPDFSDTFVCIRCKKKMQLKYLYKRNMCMDCFNLEKREQEEKQEKLRSFLLHNPDYAKQRSQQSTSIGFDPYAYKRKNVWKYQIELMNIPDLTPAREPGPGASRQEIDDYYTSRRRDIYIDSRNGSLTEASFSSPAFNATAASRYDSPITYQEFRELVKRYYFEPRVKFCVEERAAMLDLKEDNWDDWLLINVIGESAPVKQTQEKTAAQIDSNGFLSVYTSEISSLKSDEIFQLELESVTVSVEPPDPELTKRHFPVSTIFRNAFKDCTLLDTARINEGVFLIEAGAFENCISLKSVVLPSSLELIEGTGVFEAGDDDGHGSGVSEVTHGAAFENCPRLETVYYMGTKEQWSKINVGPGNDCLLNAKIVFDFERNENENESKNPAPLSEPLYLFGWEEQDINDMYASHGKNYKYLPNTHQLCSSRFHAVAGGFGSIGQNGTSAYTPTSWESLLFDMIAYMKPKMKNGHFRDFNEETWKIICSDAELNPEMKTDTFNEIQRLIDTKKK